MRPLRRAIKGAIAAAVVFLAATPALAAQCGKSADGFDDWLAGFKTEAAAAGVSRNVIQSALSTAVYDENVISHDRGQRAFAQSFATFSSKHISTYAIKKGQQMMLRYAEPLQSIQKRWGVPGQVLVAIWGLETGFGAVIGKFDTFSALATLAYDCRRTDQFHAELLDALKIVQRGDIAAQEMHGAWAGEIGQTQFMPSSYLKYATDIYGRGSGDLIRSPEDALASTANYLHAKGWKNGQAWDEGQPNFDALLEWNAANVYAKTIALFADKIGGNGTTE